MSRPLYEFIANHPRLVVITGAGCSAPSGIPTYRNAAAEWQRPNPIQHRDFLSSEVDRQRYWIRSFAGWPAVREALPNQAHRCLADLERRGIVQLLVTQNVDQLHHKAEHQRIVELHGRLDQVICLDCGDLSTRQDMQLRLSTLNPGLSEQAVTIAPDGDAEVSTESVKIRIPECRRCGGVLKPNVVFFGGAVPRYIVNTTVESIDSADGVLVVGSSLTVFSAFRFCRHAHRTNKPIAIINRGITRADDLATLKLDGDCQQTFVRLLNTLS